MQVHNVRDLDRLARLLEKTQAALAGQAGEA